MSRQLGLVEPKPEIVDVGPERRKACEGDLLTHEVADQQAQERIALERRERDRRAGVVGERLTAFRRQRVDRPVARLARLLPGGEVPELGKPFRLRVVLALPGPGEHAPAAGESQQVVSPGTGPPDQPENLVGEERQLFVDKATIHSLKLRSIVYGE